MCECMYVRTYVSMHVYMYECMHAIMYACMCMCTDSVYVRVNVCMHVDHVCTYVL
jgi:hypothetical protein